MLQKLNITVEGMVLSTVVVGWSKVHMLYYQMSLRIYSNQETGSEMDIIRLFPVIGAAVAVVLLLRKVFEDFSGPSREEKYKQLEAEQKKSDKKITGRNTPRCPLCGGDTERYQYPHIRVWRCVRFPECRGFVKSAKGGASFARRWRDR